MLATNALSSYSSVSTQKFVTIRAEMLSIPARVDAERDTTTQPAPE